MGSAVCFWICCRVVAVSGFDMIYILGRRWDEFLASWGKFPFRES